MLTALSRTNIMNLIKLVKRFIKTIKENAYGRIKTQPHI